MPIETIDRETYHGCARLVERAVKTIMALPDPDAKFRRMKSGGWPEMVQNVMEAYGATEAAARFRPSAKDVSNCLPVLDWLTWLKAQQGAKQEFEVIWAHALGASYVKMAWRFGKNERTVRRWHECGIVRICAQFEHEIEKKLDE